MVPHDMNAGASGDTNVAHRTAVDGSRLYQQHAEYIERAISSVVSRLCRDRSDAEDLGQELRLRTLTDRRILGTYEGRASLFTFLFRVYYRLGLNWCHSRYGRWRPSGRATKMGADAVLLERLVLLHRLSDHDAAEAAVRAGSALTRGELLELTMRLRSRRPPGRALVALEQSRQITAVDNLELLEQERELARRVRSLRLAIVTLNREERRLVILHFYRNISIGSIADAQGIPRRDIYRQFAHIKTVLRRDLNERGRDRLDRKARS
jgi:RNA polymerase sigma factor (sigma-70 family)